MERDGVIWDRTGVDGAEWYEMGWYRMGWDGMGWEEM